MSADANIKIGKHAVVASGLFITWGKEAAELELTGGLRILITFENNTAHPEEQTTRADAIDDKSLRLTMTNFNNVLGTGTNKPIHIGQINGKSIHLAYRVYAFGADGDKTVQYTVYQDA